MPAATFIVFCILGVVALVGRELLQLLGINLGAFAVSSVDSSLR